MRVIFAALLVAMIAGAPGFSKAEEKPFVRFKVLSPAMALKLAQEVLKACQAKGYQTAIAVVDRFGGVQVVLRDRYAGPHTVDTARRKAWTAVSFRTDTWEMYKLIKEGTLDPGVRNVRNALMVGGGVRVMSGGSIVGAVGVSGAPGGKADHDCAAKGIAKIQDDLEF